MKYKTQIRSNTKYSSTKVRFNHGKDSAEKIAAAISMMCKDGR